MTRVSIDTDALDPHFLPHCRLIYSDASFRSSLIFSLLPESYTDVLGAMLGSLLHPSPPVCAALATLATPLSAPKHHEHTHERMQAEKRGDTRGDTLLEAPCVPAPGADDAQDCVHKQHAACEDCVRAHAACVRAHAACAGGTGEQGWYVGMHVRQSGLWDPSGSSPGALFALRTAGNCPILHHPFHCHPLVCVRVRARPRVRACLRACVRASVRACACVDVCLCMFVCVEILNTV